MDHPSLTDFLGMTIPFPIRGWIVIDPEITPVLPFWSYFRIGGHPELGIGTSQADCYRRVLWRFGALRSSFLIECVF